MYKQAKLAEAVEIAAGPDTGTQTRRLNKKQLSRERSTEVILAATLRLCVEKGYANMTIEHVAEVCGVTKGAVYHYYPGKEQLLLALLDQIQSQAIGLREEQGQQQGESAAEWLDRFIKTLAYHATRQPDAFLLLVTLSADLSNINGKIGEKVDAIFREMRDTFQLIVTTGQTTGEFTKDMLARDLALFWISAFTGNVLQWHRSGRDQAVGRGVVRALRVAVARVLTSRLQ
jgi:AcrR family transcriptional regulator